MNKSRLFGLAIALLTPFFGQPAQAEMLVLGTASTGQTVTLLEEKGYDITQHTGTLKGVEKTTVVFHCQ